MCICICGSTEPLFQRWRRTNCCLCWNEKHLQVFVNFYITIFCVSFAGFYVYILCVDSFAFFSFLFSNRIRFFYSVLLFIWKSLFSGRASCFSFFFVRFFFVFLVVVVVFLSTLSLRVTNFSNSIRLFLSFCTVSHHSLNRNYDLCYVRMCAFFNISSYSSSLSLFLVFFNKINCP